MSYDLINSLGKIQNKSLEVEISRVWVTHIESTEFVSILYSVERSELSERRNGSFETSKQHVTSSCGEG